MRNVLWVLLIITAVIACSKNEVPLDRDQFTSLLIDMHMTDGMLDVIRPERNNEKDNYKYYNDLFSKYGITRSDFDSCLNYYARNSVTFNRIYAAVIDTLNRRKTQKVRIWNQLTINDSINYFPGYTMIVADTLRADSIRAGVPRKDSVIYEQRVVTDDTVHFDKHNQYVLVEVDSIVPGLYKFSTVLKWNKRILGRRATIRSYFLSEDHDTLKVQSQYVSLQDSIRAKDYKWEYYVPDSIYNKLVVKIVDSEPDKRAKVKTKEVEGWVTKTVLNRVYVAPHRKMELEKQYRAREEAMKRK